MPSTAVEAKAEASLWTFARALYAAPGAAPACLALQDRFGEGAPFLLFAIWAARVGGLTPEAAASAAEAAAPWTAAAIAPLRAIRRDLKPRLDAFADIGLPEAAAFRDRVKALELEAERLELALLARRAVHARARGRGRSTTGAPPPGWRDHAAALWRAGRGAAEDEARALFDILLNAAASIGDAAMEFDDQQP